MKMFKNTDPIKTVFTAQSKQYFYCRDAICEFVMTSGCLPLNPFRVFGYFLDDRVDRDLVRRGNNNLIRICDELWVFGTVADGVLFEIEYALHLGKTVRFFTMATRAGEIRPISSLSDVRFEPEVHKSRMRRSDLLERISAATPTEAQEPQLNLFVQVERTASLAQPRDDDSLADEFDGDSSDATKVEPLLKVDPPSESDIQSPSDSEATDANKNGA